MYEVSFSLPETLGEVYYTNLLPYIKFEQMDRQTDRGKA